MQTRMIIVYICKVPMQCVFNMQPKNLYYATKRYLLTQLVLLNAMRHSEATRHFIHQLLHCVQLWEIGTVYTFSRLLSKELWQRSVSSLFPLHVCRMRFVANSIGFPKSHSFAYANGFLLIYWLLSRADLPLKSPSVFNYLPHSKLSCSFL